MARRLDVPLPEDVRRIARATAEAGGRPILVGGSVRDRLLGRSAGEHDIEVFGLEVEPLERVLARFGEVVRVGRAFGVLRVKGLDADVDFTLPRRDRKIGKGHKGFEVATDPDLSFEEAARRRDLTINAMGVDLVTEELLDPLGGERDLEQGVLRAADARHFAEDPLRGLRVAQLAARFEMSPDEELEGLCAALDLSELSPERLFAELNEALLRAERPSIAFVFLEETKLLRFFPEIQALDDVPQEPEWHPEGDVLTHTLMVLDEAAGLRRGDDQDLPLMYGALCHDFGKAITTEVIDGRIRSLEHDVAGVAEARRFLERLRAPGRLVQQVEALVLHHLKPVQLHKGGAKPKAYRKLARQLEQAGVTMELLHRVARADYLGRTTEDALAERYPAGETFLREMHALGLERAAPGNVVMGRHLIARGLKPGTRFKVILDACRNVQDETGWDDPDRILDRVLGSVARDAEE